MIPCVKTLLKYLTSSLCFMKTFTNLSSRKCVTMLLLLQNDFMSICDAELTTTELNNALKSMKKSTAPGIDGLPVEFYVHF